MHATASSPVLIHTVLEAIRKQMCSDGQLAAVDLKLSGPIPSEPVFDTADEQTESTSISTRSQGGSQPADLVRKGELKEISWAKNPSPSQDTQSRSEDEYPRCRFDGSGWARSTQVDQTSDVGWLARNSRRRPRNCRWHMNFSAR